MLLYDIAVIGGGPAGAMAAIGAKHQEPSCSVAIIDRNPNGIRHKIGESLLTGRDGRVTGNAIVEEISEDKRFAKVITDAGNSFRLTETELEGMFHPPVWIMNVDEAKKRIYEGVRK